MLFLGLETLFRATYHLVFHPTSQLTPQGGCMHGDLLVNWIKANRHHQYVVCLDLTHMYLLYNLFSQAKIKRVVVFVESFICRASCICKYDLSRIIWTFFDNLEITFISLWQGKFGGIVWCLLLLGGTIPLGFLVLDSFKRKAFYKALFLVFI